MVLSRKHSNAVLPSALTLDDLPLEKVSELKYLGIYVTPDLNWSLQDLCQNKEIGQYVDNCIQPTSDPT